MNGCKTAEVILVLKYLLLYFLNRVLQVVCSYVKKIGWCEQEGRKVNIFFNLSFNCFKQGFQVSLLFFKQDEVVGQELPNVISTLRFQRKQVSFFSKIIMVSSLLSFHFHENLNMFDFSVMHFFQRVALFLLHCEQFR